MQFRKIEDLDAKTTLFRLSPGLKYVTSAGPGQPYETETHENAVVCVTESEGVPRTVIHAAIKADDGSWGYGAHGCRILDGVSSAAHALELQGYSAA